MPHVKQGTAPEPFEKFLQDNPVSMKFDTRVFHLKKFISVSVGCDALMREINVIGTLFIQKNIIRGKYFN